MEMLEYAIDAFIDFTGIIDLAVIIIAAALASSVVVLLVLIFLRLFENRIRMAYLSGLLKGIILFLALILPLYTAYLYFSLNFMGIEPVESEDFRYAVGFHYSTLQMFFPRPYRYISYILLGIWALGAVWTGVIPFFRDRKVLKGLEGYAEEISDPEFLELSQKVLKKDEQIKLYRSEFVPSPFLWGIRQKKIFLPAEEFAQEEKTLIYQHELIHCRKQDYAFRRMLALLCAVYWFNPGIYLFTRYFTAVNEMACDDGVLEGRSNEDRRLYAHLLYRISVQDTGKAYGAVSFTGFRSSMLEQRLQNMKWKNRKAESVLLAVTALAILLLCPAITYGASKGILEIQDKAASFMMEIVDASDVMTIEPVPVYEEYQKQYSLEEFTEIQNIVLKSQGCTEIDLTVPAGKKQNVPFMHFEKGTKVYLYLPGDDLDTFNAGLMDRNGHSREVASQEGMISYEFVIAESGEYAIYVENTGTEVWQAKVFACLFPKQSK